MKLWKKQHENDLVEEDSMVEEMAPQPEAKDENELETLRMQNEELRRELEERKAIAERLESEIGEFSEIFPDVPLSEIPDDIWNDVKKGIPLSASYAKHEKKRMMNEAYALSVNNSSAEKSSGSVTGSTDRYYSPDEVRKMSASEVKKNYSHIISSMKHWS